MERESDIENHHEKEHSQIENEVISVKSNIFLAMLNAVLILSTYLLVIVGTLFYLKQFHEIDLVGLLISSFLSIKLPILGPALSLMAKLLEDFIMHSFVLALIYGAFISNYEIKIDQDYLHWKKGFLLVNVNKFKLEDVEQVYTVRYTFFPKTKKLYIKALDEDIFKIPYVRNADEVKINLIQLVKKRHIELETQELLHTPIKTLDYNPNQHI